MPGRPRPVQNMPPQQMTLRQPRMFEVIRCIAHHPDFFHDSPRTHIPGHGECDDFGYAQFLQPMMQYGACRLRRQTPSPIVRRQTPSDLHAWCEVRFKRWFREPGKSNEFPCLPQFGRKEGESAFPEMRLKFIRQRVTLRSRKNPGEEFHNTRIGVHARKRLPVRLLPRPQHQALGLNNDHNQYASVGNG